MRGVAEKERAARAPEKEIKCAASVRSGPGTGPVPALYQGRRPAGTSPVPGQTEKSKSAEPNAVARGLRVCDPRSHGGPPGEAAAAHGDDCGRLFDAARAARTRMRLSSKGVLFTTRTPIAATAASRQLRQCSCGDGGPETAAGRGDGGQPCAASPGGPVLHERQHHPWQQRQEQHRQQRRA